MKRAISCVFAAFLTTAAIQCNKASAAEEQTTPEQFQDTAELFGRCAGVWRLFAEVDTGNDKLASAKQSRGLEMGAITASSWAFAMRYQLVNPDKPPRPIGHFKQRAESLRDRQRTALLAMFESGEGEQVKAEVQLCQYVRESQQEILDSIRDTADSQ